MSISATSPDGSLWVTYCPDEIPNLTTVKNPNPRILVDTVYHAPCFLSTGKTIAREWIVDNNGNFSFKVIPLNAGLVEYIEFLTPLGQSYVLGLADDGQRYFEPFDSNSPRNRRIVSPLMHKGTLLYVADNRMPIPRRG